MHPTTPTVIAAAADMVHHGGLASIRPTLTQTKGTPIDRSMKRTGYSGDKGRPYEPIRFKKGVHITAKKHQAITCAVSTTIHPDYGFDRLQKLQDRQARRAERAGA